QLQPKLLRVLQEHEVRRIGSSVSKIVDVRIIAATNRNLEQLVREKLFREDLFYRLSVIRIELPPLRERQEDIPLLIAHFMTKYTRQHNKKISGISDELLSTLKKLDWPGNVRELENFIDRSIALATGRVLSLSDIELPTASPKDASSWSAHLPTNLSLNEVEAEYVKKVLKESNNNYGEASKILRVNKSTLYRKFGKPHK
ncbi:MAG TPA: sigma 54-interacting transcriptional regulator, partial [Candidatus Acidoferrales bacterium]|nr:sigma 54-interacting transcriptional regulator [Candidatus Acidoferrales bacterium]